jgi:hypothetical protein
MSAIPQFDPKSWNYRNMKCSAGNLHVSHTRSTDMTTVSQPFRDTPGGK